MYYKFCRAAIAMPGHSGHSEMCTGLYRQYYSTGECIDGGSDLSRRLLDIQSEFVFIYKILA